MTSQIKADKKECPTYRADSILHQKEFVELVLFYIRLGRDSGTDQKPVGMAISALFAQNILESPE